MVPSAWAQSDHGAVKEKQDGSSINISDEYWEEVKEFNIYCKGDFTLSTHHDCDCMAMRYLDQRVEMGPYATSGQIMLRIDTACPNIPAIAGEAYEDCVRRPISVPSSAKSVEDYCACFANTYAKLFKASGRAITSKLKVSLQTRAGLQCDNANTQ